MVFALMSATLAGGISEQYVRDEYKEKGGFPNRDAWLYELNSIAKEVFSGSNKTLGGGDGMSDLSECNPVQL